MADTRAADCECTRLDPHTIRVVVAGRHGIASNITAAVVTVTATASPVAGFVTAYPSGQAQPTTSTLNVPVGADTSNSTIISVGDGGAIDLFASVSTNLIIDVTGTFTTATASAGGRFQPSVPTRLLDTRASSANGLDPGETVTVPLPNGVSSDARAIAVNVTSVAARGPGFLTGYAAGATPPDTSFMNPDGSGAPKAAAIILPVSPQGFTIMSSAGGHVIVDLIGWFTGDSAPVSGDGLFVSLAPTRLVDTRVALPRLWAGGTREIAAPITSISALVSNVTMANPDGPGFVTAYAAGTERPDTSSVNAPFRNAASPNFAITSVSARGMAYYSNAGTDLTVDTTGYFTGTPVAAPLSPPPDAPPLRHVLMIGDSTLGGYDFVPKAFSALRGAAFIVDAKPCRRLVHPSCKSPTTGVVPNTAIDALNAAQGPLDIVVIKTGYNDSSSNYGTNIAGIMTTARARGARLVIWFTYSESTRPGAYNIANATLKQAAGSAAYPDLVVADWRAFAANSSGWYASDRVHLNALGVWATSDYASRWVSYTTHMPCPIPWTVGGPIDNPCPNPDDYAAAVGFTPDLKALYGV